MKILTRSLGLLWMPVAFLVSLVFVPVLGQSARTHINSFASAPANCSVGDVYVKTGTDQALYQCTATDTWAASGWVHHAVVSISDAQVKALPTTSITLVAAQGVGERIVLLGVDLQITKAAGGNYTNISPQAFMSLSLGANTGYGNYIANDATSTPVLTDLTSFLTGAPSGGRAWFQQATNTVDVAAGWGNLVAIRGDYETNLALILTLDNAAAGNLTGGNAGNSMTANTFYMVVP